MDFQNSLTVLVNRCNLEKEKEKNIPLDVARPSIIIEPIQLLLM